MGCGNSNYKFVIGMNVNWNLIFWMGSGINCVVLNNGMFVNIGLNFVFILCVGVMVMFVEVDDGLMNMLMMGEWCNLVNCLFYDIVWVVCDIVVDIFEFNNLCVVYDVCFVMVN